MDIEDHLGETAQILCNVAALLQASGTRDNIALARRLLRRTYHLLNRRSVRFGIVSVPVP
jgi:hypothetical protein